MHRFTKSFWRNMAHYQDEFKDKPIKYLEIGVHLGNTIEFMLNNILTHKDACAYGIDPWCWSGRFSGMPEVEWNAMMTKRVDDLRERYTGRLQLIKGYSQVVLRDNLFPDHYFDLIYIDGQHHALNVLYDFVLTWPLLKIGGIMVFDDYDHLGNLEVKPSVDCIMYALNHRGRAQKQRAVELIRNHQLWLRKGRD